MNTISNLIEPTGIGIEPTSIEPSGIEPSGIEPTGIEPTGTGTSCDDTESNCNCPICFESLETKTFKNDFDKIGKTIVTLDCRHSFHHECIVDWFKNVIQTKRKHAYCPYCREKTKYITLPPKMFPLKNIHKEYKFIEKYIINNELDKLEEACLKLFNTDYCHSVLKTGKNKGYQCRKRKCNDGLFCSIHSKKYSTILDNFK